MTKSATAVVIGTGVGGLTAAAYLGKLGFNVLALEQAEAPGGFLRPHVYGDYQFSWAVHYVGQCRRGQMLHNALADIGLDAEELFCEINPECFDIYRFPEFEVCLGRDVDAFRDRLAALFPGQVRGLERYFNTVHALHELLAQLDRISESGVHLADLKSIVSIPALARWIRHSYADFLDSLFDDQKLKAVLTAPCGNWALPASKIAALYPLAHFSHYADGAFFPRGGSGTLRDVLMARAQHYGAQFRCNAEVTSIHVKDNRVESVGLDSGERIHCDVVVSDVNPVITLGRMLKGTDLPKRLSRKITHAVPSMPVFCLFLGMNRDLRAHGMGPWNIWDHTGWDVEEVFDPVFHGKLQTNSMMFISPNSLKDDTHSLALRGKSTLEAIIWAPYEKFAKWEGIPPQERDMEYSRLVAETGDAVITELHKRCPGLVGDVEVKEYATPVDANYRVRALRGGIYGPALLPNMTPPRRFSTRTPIRNLYLAGAGVFGGSIGGSLVSGKYAAKMALKHQ